MLDPCQVKNTRSYALLSLGGCVCALSIVPWHAASSLLSTDPSCDQAHRQAKPCLATPILRHCTAFQFSRSNALVSPLSSPVHASDMVSTPMPITTVAPALPLLHNATLLHPSSSAPTLLIPQSTVPAPAPAPCLPNTFANSWSRSC